MQIKTKIVSCHTADSKPVKQEVNGTVILPPLVFLASVIILAIGKVFMRVQRKDNARVYQDEHEAYRKNVRWSFSLDATTFHPSDKVMIYHNKSQWHLPPLSNIYW